MIFKYGFEYVGIRYGWNNKKLYRLPYFKNKRAYQLLEIKPIIIGKTIVYNVQRNKITINKLKQRTVKIDWSITVIQDQICPF
jgi:hypothetical protein